MGGAVYKMFFQSFPTIGDSGKQTREVIADSVEDAKGFAHAKWGMTPYRTRKVRELSPQAVVSYAKEKGKNYPVTEMALYSANISVNRVY